MALTQTMIADITGLSCVDVSRTSSDIREQRLWRSATSRR
jgi:hypothetical protein